MLPNVTAILDTGWRGTYGQLAALCGSSARAIGACVRAYARRRPAWPHDRVVAARTGRPAYEG
jgi:alkylated DNA nucleotide flippase Atl1